MQNPRGLLEDDKLLPKMTGYLRPSRTSDELAVWAKRRVRTQIAQPSARIASANLDRRHGRGQWRTEVVSDCQRAGTNLRLSRRNLTRVTEEDCLNARGGFWPRRYRSQFRTLLCIGHGGQKFNRQNRPPVAVETGYRSEVRGLGSGQVRKPDDWQCSTRLLAKRFAGLIAFCSST